MTHARDYAKHLPHLGISPEFESDAPAYVVVFEGNVEIAGVGAPLPIDAAGNTIPQPEGAANGIRGIADVICIVVDGEPNYYGPVDKTGMQP